MARRSAGAKLGREAGGWAARATPGGATAHHAAFDVSDRDTATHVLDGRGKPVWKGERPSEPEALAAALKRHAVRAGARGPGDRPARAVAVPLAQALPT